MTSTLVKPRQFIDQRDNSHLVAKGLKQCRDITKKYGTSFYFATQFFPDDVKQGIYAIYAFARIPDEIVDDPENRDDAGGVAALG